MGSLLVETTQPRIWVYLHYTLHLHFLTVHSGRARCPADDRGGDRDRQVGCVRQGERSWWRPGSRGGVLCPPPAVELEAKDRAGRGRWRHGDGLPELHEHPAVPGRSRVGG